MIPGLDRASILADKKVFQVVRSLLEVISGKWTMLIFPLINQRARRNGELLRLVDGISQKVLTDILRELETHGLAVRHDYGTVPP